MITSQIYDRLSSELSESIYLAGTLDEALRHKIAIPPAIFVISPTFVSSDNIMVAGSTEQRVKQEYNIAILARDLSDERAVAAMAAIAELHDSIKLALLGWTPDGAIYDPLLYANGAAYSRDGYDGVWVWVDQFYTSTYYRS